jgi:CheY-like chemotaxis protein
VVRLSFAAAAAVAPTAPALGVAPTTLTGRVLVVDDEASVRRSTGRILRKLGVEVDEADSAARALERLTAGPLPTYLLTDLAMPDINGLQLAEIARQRWPGLAIAVVSGFADDAALEKIGALGAAFVGKPFSAAQLHDALAVGLALAQSRTVDGGDDRDGGENPSG